MTLAGLRARRRGLQRAVQCLRQEERRLYVQVHDLVPAGFGKLLERYAPCGPGVVDQDVELVLMLGELRGERLAPGDGRDVLGQGDAVRPEFFRGGETGIGLA